MRLSEIFQLLVHCDGRLGFMACDGSRVGSPEATAVLELRCAEALGYLASPHPELGLARAYVMGHIEVHGDLHDAISSLRAKGPTDLSWRERAAVVSRIWPQALRRPPIPAEEAPPPWRRGARHSKRRDARAISHHYDVSNRFYELVLGPSMAYSCAVFPTPDARLDDAQVEKFDLVCRKLDLRPGQRLLDFGGGWGGMIRHAARHYGVCAVGVTLSREQAAYAQRAISDAGLQRRAEMRFLDYRDLDEGGFDAICSIGAMEHIGTAELRPHFAALAARLRPEGRLLNQCVTRPSNRERNRTGPFIDRYVFPDAELQGLGTVVGAMHDNGLEVRHTENLREHYAMTLREWSANLERRWTEAVAEVGERRARIWRLYLAASRVEFERNRLQLHQALGVRAGAGGRSGTPPRPIFPARRRNEPAHERSSFAGASSA
jgi:cyclopropane-fatty-acyl-phospholipid synthase